MNYRQQYRSMFYKDLYHSRMYGTQRIIHIGTRVFDLIDMFKLDFVCTNHTSTLNRYACTFIHQNILVNL